MEVTSLCIRLFVMVSMQMGAHAQEADASVWIIPTTLQLFEYESISFQCMSSDDVSRWSILRKTRTDIGTCGFSEWGVFNKSSCTIKGAFPDDSGEYWCEAGGGKRSSSVKVTITGGSVILESPARPVMEGKAVTLRCRNKTTSSNLSADFYKDGRLKTSSSTGEMTIHSVSRCDEGLYKCIISDVGESAESWLAVRELHSETPPPSDLAFIIFRNIFPVVLMALLLLLLLGLFHWGKLRAEHQQVTSTATEMQPSH